MYGGDYGMDGGSDSMFESPPTPGMRRVTRSKAKGPNGPPPPNYRTDSPPPPPTRGRGRGRPPGRKNNPDLRWRHEDDDVSLYNIIKNCKSSLTSIVDSWIESYKVCVLDFIVFQITVCGKSTELNL